MKELAFGPFALDVPAARLLRDAAEVKLRLQAFHALAVLANHRGHYVGYEQLMAEAWHGIVVSRHTVDVTIAEVRKALREYGSWIQRRPKRGYCLVVPASDVLVRRGWHYWRLRSGQGFDKALECFEQAARVGPGDFRAFEGQAACYLLLATYGMRPPVVMYERFLETHGRAEALAGPTPELRCARAQGLHLFEHRFEDAETEFLHALRENPRLALAHVGMAVLSVSLDQLDAALASIARAYAANALMPVVPATEVSIRFWRREYERAAACGATAVELHPHFVIGRAFYAHALEFSGRLDEALAQYEIATIISQDLPWIRAFEGACLVKMRRRREACAALDALVARRAHQYVDAYAMAVLHQALRHPNDALAELERALDENSPALYALHLDPRADGLRARARFARVCRALRARREAHLASTAS